jgi:hypothetical protein
MTSRKDIEDQIAALQKQAEEMGDDGEDFEVEIWDHEGNGARVPYHAGKNWLAKFGIGVPEPESEPEGDQGGKTPKSGGRSGSSGGNSGGNPGSVETQSALRHFQKRPAAGK